jgi:hypothetical protein
MRSHIVIISLYVGVAHVGGLEGYKPSNYT